MNPVRFLYLFPLFLLVSSSASYAAQAQASQSSKSCSEEKSLATIHDTLFGVVPVNINISCPTTPPFTFVYSEDLEQQTFKPNVRIKLASTQKVQSSNTTSTSCTSTQKNNDFFSQEFLDSLSKEQAAYVESRKKKLDSIAATLSEHSSKAEHQRYQYFVQTYQALCYLATKQYQTAHTLLAAASIHSDEAKMLRAYCYEYGIGVEKDPGFVLELLYKNSTWAATRPVRDEIDYLYDVIKLGC